MQSVRVRVEIFTPEQKGFSIWRRGQHALAGSFNRSVHCYPTLCFAPVLVCVLTTIGIRRTCARARPAVVGQQMRQITARLERHALAREWSWMFRGRIASAEVLFLPLLRPLLQLSSRQETSTHESVKKKLRLHGLQPNVTLGKGRSPPRQRVKGVTYVLACILALFLSLVGCFRSSLTAGGPIHQRKAAGVHCGMAR
jgi:hypothetical protein